MRRTSKGSVCSTGRLAVEHLDGRRVHETAMSISEKLSPAVDRDGPLSGGHGDPLARAHLARRFMAQGEEYAIAKHYLDAEASFLRAIEHKRDFAPLTTISAGCGRWLATPTPRSDATAKLWIWTPLSKAPAKIC